MSTRYVSFISGMVIASLTWAFSLYLYSRLSQNTDAVNPTMLMSENIKSLDEFTYDSKKYNAKSHNNLMTHRDKESSMDKGGYNLKGNNFKNSDKLLQQLQPVPIKSAVTLGQGILKMDRL